MNKENIAKNVAKLDKKNTNHLPDIISYSSLLCIIAIAIYMGYLYQRSDIIIMLLLLSAVFAGAEIKKFVNAKSAAESKTNLQNFISEYLTANPLDYVEPNSNFEICSPAQEALQTIQKTSKALNNANDTENQGSIYRTLKLLNQANIKIHEVENDSRTVAGTVNYDNHLTIPVLNTYRGYCEQINTYCKQILQVTNFQELNEISNNLEILLSNLKLSYTKQDTNIHTQLEDICTEYFGDSKISTNSYLTSIQAAQRYMEKHPHTRETRILECKLEKLLENFKLNSQEHDSEDYSDYLNILSDLDDKTNSLRLYI